MFAVIETGGKQYKVSEGDILFVEKLNVEDGQAIVFDKVLAVSGPDGFKVGAPLLNCKVNANVIKNGKGKKINIITYKPKKGSARRMGHRQPYTKVEITNIVG